MQVNNFISLWDIVPCFLQCRLKMVWSNIYVNFSKHPNNCHFYMVSFQIHWRFYYIPYKLFALCFLSKNAFSLKLYALIGLVCVLLNFSCVSDLILISLPSLLSLKNKRNVTNQFTWINLKQPKLNVETKLLFFTFFHPFNGM